MLLKILLRVLYANKLQVQMGVYDYGKRIHAIYVNSEYSNLELP
jgi:hypothetical protein